MVGAASVDLAAASCSEMNPENGFSSAKAEVSRPLMRTQSVFSWLTASCVS